MKDSKVQIIESYVLPQLFTAPPCPFRTNNRLPFLSNRRVLSEKLLVKEEEEEPELTPGR
jgi:hypothetical protein